MFGRLRPAFAALIAADLATLALLRPDFGRLAARLETLPARVAEGGADRALATLAAAAVWLAALWLAVGLLAVALARLPGVPGRIAEDVGRMLLPAVLRRVVAGSAGLGVLLAPVGAAAASEAAPGASSVSTSLAIETPVPVWPVDPGSRSAHPAPSPSPHPSGHPAPAHPSAHPAPAQQAPAQQAPARVRVGNGDCLWLITARRLGPSATPAQVAAEWPRWYAANADVIGPDPDLIRPGQLLRPPPAEEAAG